MGSAERFTSSMDTQHSSGAIRKRIALSARTGQLQIRIAAVTGCTLDSQWVRTEATYILFRLRERNKIGELCGRHGIVVVLHSRSTVHRYRIDRVAPREPM